MLAALLEPSRVFIKCVLFALEPGDHNRILIGVFSVFDTDEDRWEITEAAAVDSTVPPSQNVLIALAPHIPGDLIDDLDQLLEHPSNPVLSGVVRSVLRGNIQ